MKKSKFIALLLTCCVVLCSCNLNNAESDIQDNTDISESEIETTAETTAEIAKESSVWSIQDYVDEFKQPTGEKFLQGIGVGTFSNSVTSNSDLLAAVIVDKHYTGEYQCVSIGLLEYEKYTVKYTSQDCKEYNVKILDDDGFKYNYYGYCYSGWNKIIISEKSDILEFLHDGDNGNSIISGILKNNNTLKIYIEDKEDTNQNYLFTIDMTGFKELYDENFD